MWFFNYFASSYIITSSTSFIYDTCTNSFKHFSRSKEEVIKCAKHMLPTVCVNLFGVTLPYSLFIEHTIKDVERNDYGLVLNFAIVFLIADFVTYWLHRLFHHPKFYWMHKVHHEYTHPLAMGAVYAHPIDYFVVNLGPFTLPIFILYPPDWIIQTIVVLAVSITTIQSHGGYTFFDDAHLKHHKYYKVNYGLGLMDRVFGTFK